MRSERSERAGEKEVQRALATWCAVMLVSMASSLTLIRWDSGHHGIHSFIGTTPEATSVEVQPPTF
jgi:hypothetical protein